jgi:hypothetical protein
MNDAVHVQVQIIELHAVRIRFRYVNVKRNTAGGCFLHDIDNRSRVSIREPPVKRWHSHISGSVRSGSEKTGERER